MFKIEKNYLSISMYVMVNWKSMVLSLSRILTATDFKLLFDYPFPSKFRFLFENC